jgi:dienelactone hydrolase
MDKIKAFLAGCSMALTAHAAFPADNLIQQVKNAIDQMQERTKAPATDDPLLLPFLARDGLTDMSLSPDGKHALALSFNGVTNTVMLIDIEKRASWPLRNHKAASDHTLVPHAFLAVHAAWIGNDLIVVNSLSGAATFDLDGNVVQYLQDRWITQINDPATGQPSDFAWVQRKFDNPKGISRMNVRTGENFSVDISLPGELASLLCDRNGEIRVVQTSDTAFWSDVTRISTWYRASGDAPWKKIDERSINDDPFLPVMIGDRAGHLVVQARNGEDRTAIWDFDVERRSFVEVMARHPSEDIVAVRDYTQAPFFAEVMADGLKPLQVWFDPRMDRLQRAMDAALPGAVNTIRASSNDHVLVFSHSDQDPGHWYALDVRTMQLKSIAAARARIQPERMQPMRALRYPSFDGTMVPAYLTLPGKPTKQLPTIVLIHGGPQARDRWDWDDDVQVFAAHGYAVFQPQFRGSTGFGKKFEESGYGQWGLSMQDDITAGVKWLVDQKIAAPDRICIVGASYGGYAALWGLAKTPELYKCGVSTAGVSDIENMLKGDSDFNQTAVGREVIRHKVGDPKTMAASFDAVSPLKHADRVVAPVLVVHGDRDARVPVEQSKRMVDELQRLHKDVKYIEFEGEGHGVAQVAHRTAWYEAMLALFARTIGKGEPPFPPVPAAAASGAAP